MFGIFCLHVVCHVSLHTCIFEFKTHTHTVSVSSRPDAEQTTQEAKKEVEQHLKKMDEIDYSLPSSIVIGPFYVHVEVVRKNLSSKRKALAKTILDRMAQRLRKEADDVSHLFKGQIKLYYCIVCCNSAITFGVLLFFCLFVLLVCM